MAVPIVTAGLEERSDRGATWPLVAAVASAFVHFGLFSFLTSYKFHVPAPNKKVDIEIVEVKKPPPPPPKPPEEKKPEPPKPPPPKKVAVKLPPPPKEKPPPAPPPPPNQPPPPPDNKPPPPINIGLTLDSTAAGGAFAAPVGNTMYGKAGEKAPNPSDARPYQPPPGPPPKKFVPSYAVTENPSVIGEPKPTYPEDARKEGLEGQVTLKIKIDSEGKVISAKVIQGAGHGFDESALEGIRKYRFKPAKLNGEAVETEISFTITFLLD